MLSRTESILLKEAIIQKEWRLHPRSYGIINLFAFMKTAFMALNNNKMNKVASNGTKEL